MDKAKITDLRKYKNSWYKPGGSALKRGLWYLCNAILFKSWLPGNSWRRLLLLTFGAKIGKAVILKPNINIKYPWNLSIGDHSWIGEKVWIDNLGKVEIGNNCCVSQGALLLCGNHNYKKSSFDLIIKEIKIEDGAWIGAKCLVGPGVICGSHAVLSAGSVATSNLEPRFVYSGNPAQKIREREIDE